MILLHTLTCRWCCLLCWEWNLGLLVPGTDHGNSEGVKCTPAGRRLGWIYEWIVRPRWTVLSQDLLACKTKQNELARIFLGQWKQLFFTTNYISLSPSPGTLLHPSLPYIPVWLLFPPIQPTCFCSGQITTSGCLLVYLSNFASSPSWTNHNLHANTLLWLSSSVAISFSIGSQDAEIPPGLRVEFSSLFFP